MEVISKNDLLNHIDKKIVRRKTMFIPLICMSAFALVGYAAADKEAPVINSNSVEVLYGTKLDETMFNITDNRDSLDTLDVVIDDDNFDCNEIGTYNVPVTVTDHFSNTTSKTVVVEVVDKTAPVISVNESAGYTLNIEVNSSNDIKYYVSASDNVDGDVTAFITTDVELDTSELGTQVINVSADDNSGNTSTQQLVVNVVDTTAPTIKLTKGSSVTANYGKSFKVSKYYKVTDNYDEEVSDIVVDGEVDTSAEGDYELVITATDSSGNSSSKTLTVTVDDLAGPTITLSKSKVSIKNGASFSAKSYLVSAIDNKDGDVTSDVKISSSVNTKSAGTYTVTYSVSDSSGNTSTKTLKVTVQPTGNAAIVATAKSKLGCKYVYGATGPYTFDCSGFTQWVYKQNGKSIPRTSSGQKAGGTVISLSELQVGDIVWRSGHVGIYVGNGLVIHSPHTGSVVSYTSVSGFTCGVRY